MAKKRKEKPGPSPYSDLVLGTQNADFRASLMSDLATFILLSITSIMIGQLAQESGKTRKEIAETFIFGWKQAVMERFKSALNDYSSARNGPMGKFLSMANILEDEEAVRVRFTKNVNEVAKTAVDILGQEAEGPSGSRS